MNGPDSTRPSAVRSGQVDDPRTSGVFYRNQRRQFPVIERAEGMYFYDKADNAYLDAVGGAAVVTIGHGVPEVLAAMARQSERVCFVYGGMFTSQPQIELAERVLALAPEGMSKVFFVSGGSEATETALKLARQYHVEVGNDTKYKMISRWGSYHGNTVAGLSMSGRLAWRKLYDPLLLKFRQIAPAFRYRCEFCATRSECTLECAAELERAIVEEGPETVAGFIADPIVGSTLAAAAPAPGYFAAIREICDKYDVLLILDEVITGFGRTGENFAIQHWGIVPDIIACGKGISSGYVPLGAVILHERLGEAFNRGSGIITHGFTYAGNPLACAIGLAVQEYVESHGLTLRSAELGSYLHDRAERLGALRSVGEVRGGKGLFLGIELVADQGTREPYGLELRMGERVFDAALERGVVLVTGRGGPRGEGGDCVMVAPPFVITREQIDHTVDVIQAAILDAEASVVV